MKNFIQPGEVITVIAPYDVKSGSPVMVGAIFGIACNDALKNDSMELKLTGVFSLPKPATETWSIGTLLYWNEVTNTLTSKADNNKLIGVSVENSAAISTNAAVRLNASFVPTGLAFSEAEVDDIHKGLNGARE